MTTATDGEALSRAIIEQPADDLVRLAYADFLEENGGEKRAEFIRLQIELAVHYRAKAQAEATGKPWTDGMRLFSRREEIRARESGLAHDDVSGPLLEFVRLLRPRRVAWQWWKDVGCAQLQDLDDTSTVLCGSVYFRRGFADRVVCRSGLWEQCGPAVAKAHPVRRVELTDKLPRSGVGFWQWTDDAGGVFGDQSACLPVCLFGLIDREPTKDDQVFCNAKFFSSELRATDALSDALILWARKQP